MLAAIGPVTMNFPFSFPYDDDDGGDLGAQSILDPSFMMTMNEEDRLLLLLSPPWPAAASTVFPFRQQSQQQRQHEQEQEQYHQRHADPQIPATSDVPSQSPDTTTNTNTNTNTNTPSSQSTSPPGSNTTTTYRSETSRWRALVGRDPRATDAFVYAVVTTKIYCRPDCRARLARRANVRFYDLAAHAERGGFRACKRCKPNRARAAFGGVPGGVSASSSSSSSSSISSSPSHRPEGHPTPTSGAESVSCRRILPGCASAQTSLGTDGRRKNDRNGNGNVDAAAAEDAEDVEEEEEEDIHAKIHRAALLVRQAASSDKAQVLSLAQLAAQVGLSKWHLQRVFKALRGVSPREMAEEIIQANKQAAPTAGGLRVVSSGEPTSTNTPSSRWRSSLLTDTAVSAADEEEEKEEWESSDAYARAFPASHPPPANPSVADDMISFLQPPPQSAMLPLLQNTGVDWFHHEDNTVNSSSVRLPSDYQYIADDAGPSLSTMPLHTGVGMGVDMDMNIDMDMVDMDDIHAAAEVQGLLRDLFPDILVY
ncbi:hypothetical protein AYL99_02425 [Fonsecaea erecta]|uniref:HTH araC/xylS-type domain-containing protein n=1 Tax=Fonsecaea erecta TaxID=1367422 RepID=A0A178ZTU6_9EURO|nr:hypothetical protein AYL99_02425 [Fonsecaea erecta]OAP63198.1 hypothetical protein AYL99_02425 [Fonsecaea erecta]